MELNYNLNNAEKFFDKIQCPLMTKTLKKLEIEGSLIKAIYKRTTTAIILIGR